MPMFVAGYYMTFPTTRTIMGGLQIDDRGVEDERLEFPINNWLAENNHLHVLAGAIWHPTRGEPGKEDGVILMTHFVQADFNDDPIVKNVKEDEKTDIPVRNWLVKEGGVRPEDLEWMGLWDDFFLTRSGIEPRRNDIKGSTHQRRLRVATEEEFERWIASKGMTFIEFLEHEEKLRAAGELP